VQEGNSKNATAKTLKQFENGWKARDSTKRNLGRISQKTTRIKERTFHWETGQENNQQKTDAAWAHVLPTRPTTQELRSINEATLDYATGQRKRKAIKMIDPAIDQKTQNCSHKETVGDDRRHS